MKRHDVTIPCGLLKLEGVLELPFNAEPPFPAAVICHPHPLYGGNMHNNVVHALRNGLLDRGFACLRFNFRGVEGSGGTHGDGMAEEEDVLAAVDFLAKREDMDPNRLLIAGYSFGCWVGLKAVVQDLRPALLVGISPPLEMYDFGFLGLEARPKLLIGGDRDFVCSKASFQNLAKALPEPKRCILLPGTDHFHSGGENALIRELHGFLDEYDGCK